MVQAEQIVEKASEELEQKRELLRPVAEWFHSHEGELFERYEAAEKLAEDEDIDSDDERLLHQVVSNLATDRVDPVQNVVKDSTKWVGVIDYDEHDYWYEYVEHDDVEGRVNVGVCAKCVKEADSDASVAKGVGTTEELSERIKAHYDEEHDAEPDAVETGATLVSGTTIAGNSAITSATDGKGSGLDADGYRGDFEPSVSYDAGKIISKFSSPSSQPTGVGFDSNDSIWNADASSSIYKLNQSGSVLSQFASPSRLPEGVGIDSVDSIWHTDNDTGEIYQLNQSGSVLSQFASPSRSPIGLDIDSADCVWHVETVRDSVYQTNQSGSIIIQFASPSGGSEGLGIDSSGSIWNADNTINNESIYQLDQSGSILKQFKSPSDSPTGVGFDSNNSIWNADISNSIYQLYGKDKTGVLQEGVGYSVSTQDFGTILSQISSPSTYPAGLGIDSNDCIWNVDDTSTNYSIYQLDRSGNEISRFTSPSDNPKGLGLDSSDSLWHADVLGSIYQLDQSGSTLSKFASPSDGSEGVGLDSSDSIWHADDSTKSIYQLNQSGTTLSKINTPGVYPRGVGIDSNNCIWHSEYYDSVYQIDQSGTEISKFESPCGGSEGIGFDSDNYLWHADDNASSIYKILPSKRIKYE